MKIASKQEPQQIAINHLADIEFQDFMSIYKNTPKNHIHFS